MHGTLRFLFLSHLLYGICVKIFIMNRCILKSYSKTKNTVDPTRAGAAVVSTIISYKTKRVLHVKLETHSVWKQLAFSPALVCVKPPSLTQASPAPVSQGRLQPHTLTTAVLVIHNGQNKGFCFIRGSCIEWLHA